MWPIAMQPKLWNRPQLCDSYVSNVGLYSLPAASISRTRVLNLCLSSYARVPDGQTDWYPTPGACTIGEILGNLREMNPEVHELFTEFHYDIKPMGAETSNQNGPVERGHLTVANAIRSMLIGGNSDVKFWPCLSSVRHSTPSPQASCWHGGWHRKKQWWEHAMMWRS